MNSKLFRHKKSGKIYVCMQNPIKVETVTGVNKDDVCLSVDNNYVLLCTTEYDNPDFYVVSTKESFNKNYEHINR